MISEKSAKNALVHQHLLAYAMGGYFGTRLEMLEELVNQLVAESDKLKEEIAVSPLPKLPTYNVNITINEENK